MRNFAKAKIRMQDCKQKQNIMKTFDLPLDSQKMTQAFS